jgi:hypothetical protein
MGEPGDPFAVHRRSVAVSVDVHTVLFQHSGALLQRVPGLHDVPDATAATGRS